MEQLIEALNHPDPRIRARSAMTLGDIKDQRACESLLRVLTIVEPREIEGPEYEVWASAAGALVPCDISPQRGP